MNRAEKAAAVEELEKSLEAVTAVYLTDYSGLTVEESNELRRKFREAGVSFKVAKNTFIRLAMERLGGFDAVLEDLNGPTAIALTDDPAAPAKIIKDFASSVDIEKPQLKSAVVDGSVFKADQLEVLAALKSKDELISDIIGLLLSPASNIVGALQSPGSNLVGVIKAIGEKAEA
ncbi:MAG: 50S ribosomal protein L10 [Candidatus Latescibacterota bacterium]|jgi:large subunit ribosomal protein L10